MKNFLVDESFKELTEHQTVVLPIACYETTIKENINGYVPLHWHEEFQFVLVLKGTAMFFINEEKVLVQAGAGLFINSGCLHMAVDEENTGCVYICVNASPHFVLPQELYSNYVYPYLQATNFPFVYLNPSEGWARGMLGAIEKINQLMKEKPAYYEVEVSEQLVSLWKNLITNGVTLEYQQTERVKSERMKQMLHYIHSHYAEKLSLDDIARAGLLSRSECCRYFKRMLKTSPLNYVTDYRIQKSLTFLRQPDSNVTTVAYQVGFNSTSYFIDKFRNKMGITPLVYKKRQGNG